MTRRCQRCGAMFEPDKSFYRTCTECFKVKMRQDHLDALDDAYSRGWLAGRDSAETVQFTEEDTVHGPMMVPTQPTVPTQPATVFDADAT